MLMVCTRDQAIVQQTLNPNSGSGAWAPINILNHNLNEAQATSAMANALRGVGVNEPLCFSAHGSNTEIGDAESGPGNWEWTYEEIAAMLATNLPRGYAGPILIHACATSIVSFSTNLAATLQRNRVLNNVWVYGYNRAVGFNESYPNPNTLATNVSLQGTQVHY